MYKINVLKEVSPDIKKSLNETQVKFLKELFERLNSLEEWSEEAIKKTMISIKRTKKEEREVFKAIYLIFFGKKYGPRIASYFALSNREFILRRIKEVLFDL